MLTSAYDPAVANFGGELWIAFECAGPGIVGSSTCMAPMDPRNFEVDPSRIYPVVNGDRNQPGNQFTASDPKLLAFGGRLYLYWTTIAMNNHQWFGIATRGAELVEQPGSRQLWVRGSGGRAIEAHDNRLSVRVWGHADMGSILQQGNQIFATAGKADGDCVRPSQEEAGCFQMEVAESSTPLGLDIFTRNTAPESRLPTNGHEYARLAREPNGQVFIIAHIVPHQIGSFQQRALASGPGVAAFPVDLNGVFAH
jgi:hypothetical protein